MGSSESDIGGGFLYGDGRIVGHLPDPKFVTGSLGHLSLEARVAATMTSGSSSISQSGNLAPCIVEGRGNVVNILAMIDTGNDTRPAGLVISHDLYRELKLDMIAVTPRRVNTAAKGASMAMVGYISELVLSIGGPDQTFRVRGVPVLEGLSHPLNVGLVFLQQQSAVISMTPEAVSLQFGGNKSKPIKLVARTSGAGTRERVIREKSSLSSCSPSNLRGGGPEQPEAGLHELVRIPGACRTEASGEAKDNWGVTIEDVGPEDEPDPSNIKYQTLLIDDVIVKNKNYENYAAVVKSGNNESCLATDR